jgi:hypothetical protein
MGRVLCPVLAPPRVWLLVWRHSRWREGEQAATSRAGGGAALGGRKGAATTAHLGMESYASCRRPPPRHLASCSLCFTSSPARESQGSPPVYALDRRRHGRGSRKQGRSVAGEVPGSRGGPSQPRSMRERWRGYKGLHRIEEGVGGAKDLIVGLWRPYSSSSFRLCTAGRVRELRRWGSSIWGA